MVKKAKVGRPKNNEQQRESLILAARDLFIAHDFESVSVRKIAQAAGKDPALIRYYFGCKRGIFAAVINETIAPVKAVFESLDKNADITEPKKLMNVYYQTMGQYPNFPRLIYRLASMEETESNRELLTVFHQEFRPHEVKIFALMKAAGLLKEDVDPVCARFSFFSMLIFPFIMPALMRKKLDVELTPEFLSHLAEQNMNLLSRGLMNSQEEI